MIAPLLLTLLAPSLTVDRGPYIINADIVGTGRPVVVIAGGPGFSGQSVWGIGFGMRRTCRTYLFDQLGTGKSRLKSSSGDLKGHVGLMKTVEDLEALRKAAGHAKWTVIGQSWGVIVALNYAAKHPASIDRLVLTSVPGIGSDGYELGRNLDKRIPADEMKKMVEEAMRTDRTEEERTATQVGMGLPYYFHEVSLGRHFAKLAPSDLFAPPVFLALQKPILNDAEYRDRLLALKNFKRPVSMIQGHQDPCGAAMPYLLKDRYFPHAKVSMLSGCGHFGWMEDMSGFFIALHKALELPLPEHLRPESSDEHPSFLREKEAMAKAGWPFGNPKS